MTQATQSVGIVGTGLIGASIGLRATANGARVLGWDTDARALAVAASRQAVAAAAAMEEIFACDIAVLAAPPHACIDILRTLRPSLRCGVVLDVASVKTPVVAAARDVPRFVGTHPFAGKEIGGAEAAEATLFEGRSWAYVPSGEAEVDAAAIAFIERMGARAFAMSAEAHDRVVATTSHVPQLTGYLLAAAIDDLESSQRHDAGGPVARELLRIARADRSLWRDIFAANRHHVADAARTLAAGLRDVADALERGEMPV